MFIVDQVWVFRFPRRADRVAWHDRELDILGLAAKAVGPIVPLIEYRGEPSRRFPYPFIGYRLLNGRAADQHLKPSSKVPEQLGAALGCLHSVDPARVPTTPAGWEQEPAFSRHLNRQSAEAVLAVVPPALQPAVNQHLFGSRHPKPAGRMARRFCHNDICAEHVLLASDGTLSGLIDWTDAMVTDPAIDFAGLITLGDWSFVSKVYDNYPLATDERFHYRLEWIARSLTLLWLADAIAGHEPLDRHLTWLERAFQSHGQTK